MEHTHTHKKRTQQIERSENRKLFKKLSNRETRGKVELS